MYELTAKSRMLKPRPSGPFMSSTSVVEVSHRPEPGTGERALDESESLWLSVL